MFAAKGCHSVSFFLLLVTCVPQADTANLQPGFTYALRSNGGRYCSDPGQDTPVKCDQNVIRPSETFIIEDAGGGMVALKSGGSNKYCSAYCQSCGVGCIGRLKCNVDVVETDQKFTIEELNNGVIALRGGKCQKYCSDEGEEVQCNTKDVNEKAEFTPEMQTSTLLTTTTTMTMTSVTSTTISVAGTSSTTTTTMTMTSVTSTTVSVAGTSSTTTATMTITSVTSTTANIATTTTTTTRTLTVSITTTTTTTTTITTAITTSTSTNTNSTTTVITSSSTTSTTTTTAIQVAVVIGEALAHLVTEKRRALIGALSSENTTKVMAKVSGATLVAQKLTLTDLQEAGTSRTEVAMEGSNIKASLPVPMLAQFGEDMAVTIVAFDEPAEAQVAADGNVVEVHGLLSIEISTLSNPGFPQQVTGLSELVVLTLGISAGTGFSCTYFDEHSQGWSSSGVQTVSDAAGGSLVCATSHLSLFGGIVHGFTAAFECSTATLLNAHGVSKIGQTKWVMALPGQLLLGFIIVTLAFVLSAYCFDLRHRRKGLLNDDLFLIMQRRQTIRQKRDSAAAVETRTKGPEQEERCDCSCCSDVQLLLQHVCTEALASMGDLCYFIKEMKNNLQDCCLSYGGAWSAHHVVEFLEQFLVHMKVDAIYGVTASKLHIQVDDVQYFMAQAREDQERCKDSKTSRNRVLDDFEVELVSSVQLDFMRFTRCSQLPVLFFWMFAARCTLISVLRSSVFIPATMSAMLFACDMHAAAALGALFFQASGGALAENADERCEPQGITQRLGRLIAVGMVTVLVGMLPSMLLARLHHRDFIVANFDDPEQHVNWRKTLRLWQVQDRLIYFLCTLLLVFFMFFNVVFIANVTAEDGMAWFICVVTSMAQTVLAVPFLMTLISFMGTSLAQLFATVRRDSSQLCLCDSITYDSDYKNDIQPTASTRSTFHHVPQSKWNSNKLKRLNSVFNARKADVRSKDQMASIVADDITDAPVEPGTQRAIPGWNPTFSLRRRSGCDPCSSSLVCCLPLPQGGIEGVDECEEIAIRDLTI